MISAQKLLHTTVSGQIAYVSDQPHDMGRRRGVEDFSITTFADGTKTLRALSVIEDPPHVVREVVQTVDATMRPLDCFVRVRTAGAFTGSGWFRWSDDSAECENYTAAEGRAHERKACAPGPVVFCNHAIVGDAWMTAAFPFDQGQGLAVIDNFFTASANKQGATGPSLNRLMLGLMWQGVETITVGAGEFKTNKFRLNSLARREDLTPENLGYEIWVLIDGSYTPALSMYRGERRYELMSYARV